MAVTKLQGGGMPDPHDVQVLEREIPVDLQNRRAAIPPARDFTETVLQSMSARGLGKTETFAVNMAMEELFSNAINFCERPNVSARAQVDATQARVEFKWSQSQVTKLEDLGALRAREIDEMSRDKDAFGNELSARVQGKKDAGEIGGPGLGLVLVGSYADEFHTSFDEAKREMTAVIVKRKVS